jgi:hypothetical protein
MGVAGAGKVSKVGAGGGDAGRADAEGGRRRSATGARGSRGGLAVRGVGKGREWANAHSLLLFYILSGLSQCFLEGKRASFSTGGVSRGGRGKGPSITTPPKGSIWRAQELIVRVEGWSWNVIDKSLIYVLIYR